MKAELAEPRGVRIWPILALLTAISAVVVALARSADPVSESERAILFIGRNLESNAERIIVATLHDLISRANQDQPRLNLTLEVTPAASPTLAMVYAATRQRDDIVAIVDNSWGSEMETARDEIITTPQPIVFLNGDRNKHNYGDNRIYLGSGDGIPDALATIVLDTSGYQTPLIVDSDSGAPAPQQTVTPPSSPGDAPSHQFVTVVAEDRYQASDELLWSLRKRGFRQIEYGETATHQDGTFVVVKLDWQTAYEIPDRAALQRVRAELSRIYPSPRDQNRKLIVLQSHAPWGSQLLQWLDTSFEYATFIAYQSVLSSDRAVAFRPDSTNELLLLGQSSTAVAENLVTLRDRMRLVDNELFRPENGDLFYMRRAVVAADLLLASVERSRVASTDNSELLARRMSSEFGEFRARALATRIGVVHIDANGVEYGNNHIVFRRGEWAASYPRQLSPSGRLIPNLQIRFSDVRISSVDIRRDAFFADFTVSLRGDAQLIKSLHTRRGSQVDSVADTSMEVDDPLARVFAIGDVADESSFSQRLVSTRELGRLAEYDYAVSGLFRTERVAGFWFPFDEHRVAVRLKLQVPDDSIVLSADRADAENFTAFSTRSINGWRVTSAAMAIDSSVPDRSRIPHDSTYTGERQFGILSLVVQVQRQPWGALMLVFLPLALILLASSAILFIRVHRTGSGTPEFWQEAIDQLNAPETLKTQSELSLGCVLAAITYLISYSTVIPRMEEPMYTDVLTGAVLTLVVLNFVFVVSVALRQDNWLFRYFSMSRYRAMAAALTLLLIGLWPAFGLA
ncbi:MAG: hypothetical protein HZA52_03400 [Planctomycetes bacterium]|nr:hypothetical protein [Planctomycetota bacterium]